MIIDTSSERLGIQRNGKTFVMVHGTPRSSLGSFLIPFRDELLELLDSLWPNPNLDLIT